MYGCSACGGTFFHFETPGQCPLCKRYAQVSCSSCGHSDSADVFINNNDACPKCGVLSMGIAGIGAAPMPAGVNLVLGLFCFLCIAVMIAIPVRDGLSTLWKGESVVGPVYSTPSTERPARNKLGDLHAAAPVPEPHAAQDADSTPASDYPKRLLALEHGSELFVPAEEIPKVTALWNRAFLKYKHNSTNQELFDSVVKVMQGTRYFAQMTTADALNYLIDQGISPDSRRPSGDDTATTVADQVLAQLQQEYSRRTLGARNR